MTYSNLVGRDQQRRGFIQRANNYHAEPNLTAYRIDASGSSSTFDGQGSRDLNGSLNTISLLIWLLLLLFWGNAVQKSLRLRRFKSDHDEIWQNNVLRANCIHWQSPIFDTTPCVQDDGHDVVSSPPASPDIFVTSFKAYFLFVKTVVLHCLCFCDAEYHFHVPQ